MPGLSNSRWAAGGSGAARSSSTPATSGHGTSNIKASFTNTIKPGPGTPITTAQHANANGHAGGTSSSAAELARFKRIVRRLSWKLPFLDQGYRQAVESPGEAELMFKLDFFEFYMLCERALVHLQGVFGVTISRGFAGRPHPHAHHIGNGNDTRPMADHRYHANVLSALDGKDNPLHEVLGTGEVRRQLARAKDLRNRWKNADEGDGVKVAATPLATYDLDKMLVSILEGFEAGYAVAQGHVNAQANGAAGEGEDGAIDLAMDLDLELEEKEWGFMVDAMDWEAV